MKHIFLIGYMGSGKSTIGCKLSYRLRRPFIDTDKRIENRQKCTINEIFEQYGEEAFRDMETDCLKELQNEKSGHVIAVGGGLVLRVQNRQLLKQLGTCIYLKAEPDTIYKRLLGDTSRPLLKGDELYQKIVKMIEEREPVYQSCADLVVTVDQKKIDEIVSEISGSEELDIK